MNDSLNQARACFLEGLAAFQADRLPEAARQFEAALTLAPGRPSVPGHRHGPRCSREP